MSELLDRLKKTDNISYEQILNKLLEKTDISLKTHLTAPLEITILEEIGISLKTNGFTLTSATIGDFIERYKQNMVSWNRLSRTEISNAIANMKNTNIPTQEVTKP